MTLIMLHTFRSLTVLLFACFSFNAQADSKIRIYSAASMTNVINEIIQTHTKKTGVKFTPVFAGSSSLARQIEKGAPVDIYISANTKWVEYLVNEGLADKNKINVIAKNELVLVSPLNHIPEPFQLNDTQRWNRLLKDERIAIGQVSSVPAGIYAKQAFSALGVWSEVKTRTAPSNSVRVALALVEREEAALGVVYKTDALVSNKVAIVKQFPKDSHDPIVYPMVVLTESTQVKAFAEFMSGNKAKQIFLKYGFN